MKKIFFTLFLAICFTAFVSAQPVATAKESISNAQESLKICAKQLMDLTNSIDQIRDKAKMDFEAEQAIIDVKKAALAKQLATYVEGNDKEGIMTLDAWPQRVAKKKELIEEEQAINLMQLKLNGKRDDFNIRMKQLEKAVSIFSEDILARANQFTNQINVMNGNINENSNIQ